jgi:outer membrane protein
MRIKLVVAAMAAVASLAPVAAQAQAAEENPWMVRVRAVYVDWENGQSNSGSSGVGVQTNNVRAQNQWLPEVDVSYFFTKNIAAELVLTYPQRVNVYSNLTPGPTGTVNALPPSLLLQYHFTDMGALKPYVGAGINYTIFSNRNNFSVSGLNNSLTVDQNSVGFVAQIGADYMFDKNWGMNVDLKYATMSTNVNGQNGLSSVGNIGKLTLNPLMPAVGVTYKF